MEDVLLVEVGKGFGEGFSGAGIVVEDVLSARFVNDDWCAEVDVDINVDVDAGIDGIEERDEEDESTAQFTRK